MPPGEIRIWGGKCGCTCVLNCYFERADTPVCAGGQLSWGSLDLASKGDPVSLWWISFGLTFISELILRYSRERLLIGTKQK